MDVIDTETQVKRRALLADPEMRELARVHAWCLAGAQSMRVSDGRLVGVPDGWPRIVPDPDRYIVDYVDNMIYQQKE